MIVTDRTKWLLGHWRWLGAHKTWREAFTWVEHQIWLIRKKETPHRLHWSRR